MTCHGEAFNPFFVGGEGKEALFGIDLAGREADPAGFLRAMKAQTVGLPGFRYFHDHDPRVLDLVLADPECAKIVLTRNPLESYISWRIAEESDQWWMANTKHLKTVRPRFDAEQFESRLLRLQKFQVDLLHKLQISGQAPFYIDYEDVLDLDVLNGIAAFLGVAARLEKLDFRFKKQNPQPIIEKVSNPQEMEAGLARIDWFNIAHSPNFEPRRNAAVPHYAGAEGVPLLFQAVKSGPEAQVRRWLGSYGEVITGFDRKSLKRWKEAHPRYRSFTVLRHPLARAHAAFSDYIEKEWMPELRPYLKRVHKFDLPPKTQKGFATVAEHRAGFLVFLELIKHIHAGRTELRMPPQLATQLATVTGFSYLQGPDLLLREDRLEVGLEFLCAEVGLEMKPLPAASELYPFELAKIYGADLEKAARDAYGRDYAGYGFGDWAP